MVKSHVSERFLNLLLDNNAIVDGHFYFDWGLHSRFHIDTDRVFQKPQNVELVGEQFFDRFKNRDAVEAVLTPNYRAGILLAHDLAARLNCRAIVLDRNRGIITLDSDLKSGQRVIVVDDAINTGKSLKQILAVAGLLGLNVVEVGIFIDRYVGSLLKDFGSLVKTAMTLRNEYEIINTNITPCPLCAELQSLSKQIGNGSDELARADVLKRRRQLELRCSYGDDIR